MEKVSTLEELDRLKQLYAAGFQDAFLENALHKVIERQVARDEADLQRINAALAGFEQEHGMSSEEFWKHYQAGETADSADSMEWNVFLKMRQRIQPRLSLLRGEELRG
jgi:hypothetical protein